MTAVSSIYIASTSSVIIMRNKIYITLLSVAILLNGCSSWPMIIGAVDEGSFQYEGSIKAARNNLLKGLRKEKYIVNNKADGSLKIDTKEYKSSTKGFLPFGPIWQEYISFSIKFHDLTTNATTLVVVDSIVYERQDDQHPWRIKDGDAYDSSLEDDMIKKIELIVRGRG